MSTSREPSAIVIRPLQSWDEYLAAEEIQRVVWRMPDWRDAVPANLLITIHKNGGILLGAFDGTRLVGLAFSFVGIDRHFDPPVWKHCSHMLAVREEYQSRKLGVQLKFVQRELALAQQIALMTWTYDPLLALNANLNLGRLGAIARRYVPEAYGEMTDGLNAGLPSDRFEVEWWLASARVRERAAGPVARTDGAALERSGAQAVFTVERDARELPHIHKENDWGAQVLLVAIPADLAALKAADPGLAREWRVRTRSVFQRAFAAGYAATDFVLSPQTAYVLTHTPVER